MVRTTFANQRRYSTTWDRRRRQAGRSRRFTVAVTIQYQEALKIPAVHPARYLPPEKLARLGSRLAYLQVVLISVTLGTGIHGPAQVVDSNTCN